MAKISLKKDYMDGNILYGKDLNPNFETIETTINDNDATQAETNAEVEEALTQLNSDMTQAQTDIGELQEDVTNLESGITSGDSNTLESAKSYTDTKLQDYAKTTDVPTKISQLKNDDNTVKDASYVHTDNNYSTEEKNKLAGLSNYELPVATSDTLGGIKLGNGVEIESDGTLNVTGGSSGDGIPTLVGTQESPIVLFNPGVSVEVGLSYISGYTKDVPNGEVHNNYNGLLLYTMSDGTQIIGPDFEDNDDPLSSTKANLVFWFRKNTLNGTSQLFQPFVKYSANEVITNTEQGYVTPKAVYDYVGALASLNTTDKSSIVNAINELVNSAGTPGPQGPQGPQGETGPQGPQGPAGADGVTPTIGENGNWYLGEADTGKPSRGEKGEQGAQGLPGPTGPGVPTGGTTGQVLSKNSDSDYDTVWKTLESSSEGIPELIGTQDDPVLLYNIVETGIYKIIGSYKTTEAGNTVNNNGGSLIFYVDKDNEGNIAQKFWGTNTAFRMNARIALAFAGGAEALKTTAFDSYEMVSNLQRDGASKFIDALTLRNSIGYNDKNSLQTTDKSSLVAAINELKARIDDLETSI